MRGLQRNYLIKEYDKVSLFFEDFRKFGLGF